MKHCLKQLSLRLGVVAIVGLLVPSGALYASIVGTKHNLSITGTGSVKSTDETEVCIFCHTPHQAIKNDNIPLWNHDLSTTASYGVYTSPTFDGASSVSDLGGTNAATAAVSNLCLSCHDGTIAINSLNNPSNATGGNPTMTGTGAGGVMPAGTSNIGADLTDDHPVNFRYDAALFAADSSLHDPASLTEVRLFNGFIQCASCHDPHESTNPTFLRVDNTGSALCLKCHNK